MRLILENTDRMVFNHWQSPSQQHKISCTQNRLQGSHVIPNILTWFGGARTSCNIQFLMCIFHICDVSLFITCRQDFYLIFSITLLNMTQDGFICFVHNFLLWYDLTIIIVITFIDLDLNGWGSPRWRNLPLRSEILGNKTFYLSVLSKKIQTMA